VSTFINVTLRRWSGNKNRYRGWVQSGDGYTVHCTVLTGMGEDGVQYLSMQTSISKLMTRHSTPASKQQSELQLLTLTVVICSRNRVPRPGSKIHYLVGQIREIGPFSQADYQCQCYNSEIFQTKLYINKLTAGKSNLVKLSTKKQTWLLKTFGQLMWFGAKNFVLF